MLCMMVSKLGLSSEEEGGGVVVYTTWIWSHFHSNVSAKEITSLFWCSTICHPVGYNVARES